MFTAIATFIQSFVYFLVALAIFAFVVERMSDDYFEGTPLLWKLKRKISNLIEPVLLTEDTNNPNMNT